MKSRIVPTNQANFNGFKASPRMHLLPEPGLVHCGLLAQLHLLHRPDHGVTVLRPAARTPHHAPLAVCLHHRLTGARWRRRLIVCSGSIQNDKIMSNKCLLQG